MIDGDDDIDDDGNGNSINILNIGALGGGGRVGSPSKIAGGPGVCWPLAGSSGSTWQGTRGKAFRSPWILGSFKDINSMISEIKWQTFLNREYLK